MIHSFGIFEVGRILHRSVGIAGRREAGPRLGRSLRGGVLVKVLFVLQLTSVDAVHNGATFPAVIVVLRIGDVLRPKRWIGTVLEDQVGRHI